MAASNLTSESTTSENQTREVDYIFDPIDDIFAADDRLSSIFGAGIVIQSTVGDPTSQQEVLQPESMISKRVKQFEECSKNFHLTEKRVDFVEIAHKTAKTQTSVQVKYDSRTTISLTIDPSHIKSYQEVKIQNKKLSVPIIKSGWFSKYESMFEAATIANLERAAETFEAEGKQLNIDKTLTKMNQLLQSLIESLTTTPERQRCQMAILMYIISELHLTHRLSQLITFYDIATVIDTESQAGAFIRMSDLDNTPDQRMATMIHKNSVGYDDNPIYNLSYRNVRNLVLYIFSKDPGDRVQAKVELLSSTSANVRADIITQPGLVLLGSIREYLMTREEILSLVFKSDSDRRAMRCVHCATTVSVSGLVVDHTQCPVTSWLVQHFQFEEDRFTISAPQFAYIRPGIVAVSKALAAAQKKIRGMPYIGRSDKETVAFTLDDTGQAKKIGTVVRNLPSVPSTSAYQTRSTQ